MASDLVKVIWSGPFEAHVGYPPVTAQPGDVIEVSPRQAAENPGWYRPVPEARPTVAFARAVAEAEAA